MATVTLVEVQPRQASGAAVVTVRLAGGGTRSYTQRGQSDWLSGVARPPRFTSALGFDQRGFTGGALPQTGAVRFAPSRGEVKTALGGLVWQGARIVVRVGDDQNPFEDYPVKFIGTVASHSFDRGALALTVADLSADLAKPVLSGTFAGTGGLEGDEEATGRAKRRSWGSVFNVEGFILDKANLIYEFGDPARKLTGFPLVKDKGDAYDPVVAVAWQGSSDATLAALRATAVPEGGVAVAPSISCVKPWTRPAGPITADLIAQIVPNSNNPPAWIAASIVREFSATIGLPNENEAAAWQPGDAGIHAAEPNETAASILDRLLFPVSIAWVLLGNGQLYFRRLRWDVPVFELNAETVEREVVYPPLRTRRLGFQLNNRIHSDGEISATLLASVDPTYADGTPIDVLRPAEAGANITENRSSAGFYGQGALATLNQLANGGPYLSGFGGLSFLEFVKLGASDSRGSGLVTQFGFPTSDALLVTEQGTAAAIFGQGLLATLNQLANGSQYLTGFGALSSENIVRLGQNIADSFGSILSNGQVITAQGTAAAFFGQGPLATSTIAPSTILNSSPNLVVNGGFRLKLANWGNPGGHWSFYQGGDGGFAGYNDPGRLEQLSSKVFPAIGSVSYVIQAEGWTAAGSALVVEIAWQTPDGLRYNRLNFPAGFGWTKRFLAVAAPKNVTGAYIQIFKSEESGAGQIFVRKVKFSTASDEQPFSDEATYGMIYEDGTYGELLRPGEFNANVTENRTAAGFYGQGILATLNAVAYGSQIANLPSAISPGAFFDNGRLLYASRVVYDDAGLVSSYRPEEAGSNRTEGRTAAAITGQTQFATLPAGTSLDNSVFGMPSRLGNYGGFLSADQMTYTGGPGTVSVASLRPGEAGANVTEGRTSAAIAGQGALATKSTIAGDSDLSGILALRLIGSPADQNYLNADRVAWNGGATVQAFKPQEPGANVTEARTAAAIYGQGTLATTDRVRLGSGGGMVDENNSYWLTTSTVVTSAGVSSGFAGQGSFATQSYLSLTNTAYFAADGRFEASSFGQSYFRADRLAYAAGSTAEDLRPGERGANITETRTASAIVGQQYLATNYPARLYGSPQHGDGYLAASAMAFAGGNTVEGLRPGEAGANVTEARQAASIYGQSGFATASNITRDNIFSAGFFNLNAFSLGYSVTRSDGTTTVTESLVVTQVGVAAGFSGQGALATKNKVGGNDFEVSYNGQGGRVERDGNGTRIYANNGNLAVKIGF